MTEAQTGDTVQVHYTGELSDGTPFDTTREGDPLEFTLGDGKVITGFEEAVVGMTPGETKTVELQSAEAYGPHREELVQVVERSRIPDDVDLEVGARLAVSVGPESDRPLVLTVVDLEDETVTLDANHPLAGKDLTFTIELVKIV